MPFPARGEYVKLGKGSLLIDVYGADGLPSGKYDFVGNANQIDLTSDITTAELFSSTEKSGALIDRRVLRSSYTLTATLNEQTLNNLALFLLGTKLTDNQAAAPGLTVNIANVKRGGYYKLGKRSVSNVVVAVGSVILQADVDYKVNTAFGVVQILDNALAVTIVDDDNLTIDFDAAQVNVQNIAIARESGKTCSLLFLADDSNNDAKGAHDKLEIWRASIAPDGALGLIGEDYAAFNLSFSILSDAENHPADPFGTLDRAGASL